ncbi:hexosaminidase [Dysgonomonas sp. PFB1-18]|uniref:glycoside hydrolase family 20 protein n=1 Tax=unclassified Dysgonomonas TaxID=2630389 RepID=UPI0024761BA9|nr:MULTISPECIES: glycoside hydrolase family 20 protein [unclassified Dysgonomonas]MDH6308901.1 hexosaminidase [Dysgonomonas sp. PF1-14]MDH6338652.1 hexosaminidase [Dysgonomonas sp. PF1-16]MDH6380320.1 hexosaminidase [Dysgonomonas sp. PFB1-18]MDH6397650.1 hexosaminidase [Dysgonomonas sp. PF1-23]
MRRLLFLFMILVTSLSACNKVVVEANYNIIPLPQTIEMVEGEPFILDSLVTVTYDTGNKGIANVAGFLTGYIEQAVGHRLSHTSVQENSLKKTICLKINDDIQHPEGYRLEVDSINITIEGADEAGLFYGVQTLRKSIPVVNKTAIVVFSAVKIEDYPRFAYRGMMLDVSRHFWTVDFIKRYIDILALHNINKFHMHLTEDQGWRIEIKSYPKLTQVGSKRKETIKGFITGEYDNTPHGGFYTQEELKDIVQYAAQRYIEVIPEVDLPGHMLAALASYPELGCTGGPYEVATKWGIHSDVLCGGNEKTYEFLEKVFTEIFEIFPSQYIHIGGDECPKTRWKECPKCQAKIKLLGLVDDKDYTKESKLQSHMTHRLEKFISSRGRKLVGWDEIIEGGLAPNATVMSWRGEKGAQIAARMGRDIIMAPNSHLYFDYYQTENTKTEPPAFPETNTMEEVYNFNPIPGGLTEEEAKHIIGVQANLWVEQIKEESHVEYMLLPRLAALAEIQWKNDVNKDYPDFLKRTERFISLYNKLGYNFSAAAFEPSASFIEDTEKKTLKIELSTPDNADIFYTLDGSLPTQKSKRYTEPVLLAGKGAIKARAYRSNELIDNNLYVQDYTVNKTTLRNVELLTDVSRYFQPPGGKAVLTDGRRGNDCHVFSYTTAWLGFSGKMVAVVDLDEEQEISSVVAGTLLVPNSKGAKYTISVSKDGKEYTEVFSEHKLFNALDDLNADVKNTRARYVKVEIEADNYAHVLVDEIIIE